VGLHFEELLQTVLVQRAQGGQKVFALGNSIPQENLIATDAAASLYDPHVWFDASLWSHAVEAVIAGLIELDPEGEAEFRERGEIYRQRLLELHDWAKQKAAELPPAQRVLVTSHDAYNYFGRAYGFEVVGLMGISTASEAGLADITRLVDFIRQRQIKAIFVESSVSPRAIQRVSRDSGAVVGGELFSDALGAPGEERRGFDVGTYEGMFRYNLTTIVEALR
jgi:manganese/zinc/iron transport system substrate-binding protein